MYLMSNYFHMSLECKCDLINLSKCKYTLRFKHLLNSASPHAINTIIALSFASSDYHIYLQLAMPRAINVAIITIHS